MPELTEILRQLPEESMQPWWLAAMRQDEAVWQALRQAEKLPDPAALPIEKWSPAALALAAIEQPPDPTPWQALGPTDIRLRRRAGRAFERHTQPHSSLTPEIQADLAEAGLLALALRERRRLIGSWEGLRAELSLAARKTWATPLACLFGLIGDPQALLVALLGDGSQPAWNKLAFHALLSNPLPLAEQATILSPILPDHPLPFLEQLAHLRLPLARRLATHVLSVRIEIEAEEPQTSNDWADSYHHNQETAALAALSGDPYKALNYMARASQHLQQAQGTLDAQTARLMQRYGLADAATCLAHWRQAVELAPNHPDYGAGLAHALLDDGQTTEAAQVMQASISQHEHPDMSFALARLAYESGDNERARHLAIQTLQILEQNDSTNNPVERLAALGTLLLELGRPRLAAQAAEQALLHNPADAGSLSLLAQARFAAKELSAGMQAMHMATRLEPDNLSLRRQYAAYLESQNDWASALEERQSIVRRAQPGGDLLPDLYGLAACALHAQQPALTITTCQQALAINPENGPLHALYGEALDQTGERLTAREHFNAATLLAPGMPGPWLALAKAFQRDGQAEKAIEILRAAAQAAPQAADIHLALGQAYLAANSPTAALEALRRAASLEPANSHLPLPLAQALHHLGYLNEARQVIEASHWQNAAPDTQPALAYTYAQVLLAQGNLASALPALQAVIASNPSDAAPYLDYACTLLTLQQDIPQAIEALRHVIDIAPHQLTAHAFLAEALVAAGDLPAAITAYRAALESDLARDALWRGRLALGLGETALALRQTDTAVAALHEASQYDPQNPQVYHALADAYQQVGLMQNALQAMRAALHITNDDLDELLWFVEKAQELAITCHQGGESAQKKQHCQVFWQEAIQAMHQAIHYAPHRPDLRLRLAKLHLLCQEVEPARLALNDLLYLPAVPPTDFQNAAQLLLESIGDPATAIACLEKALSSATPETLCDLLSDLALAHQQAGDPAAALQSIERALEVPETPAETLAELRRVKAQRLLDLDRPAEALAWIEKALTSQPADADLHQMAAQIYRQQGQLAAALEHLEQAASYQPQPTLCLQAADLARSMLHFDLAERFLQTASQSDMALDTLHAEIALESDAEIDAANAFTRALQHTSIENIADASIQGRLLLLQTRLTLRRGDAPAAHEIYRQASVAMSALDSIPAGLGYALTATALDLEDWETALQQARLLAVQNPHEPCAAFQVARVLIRRAEAQRLYESVQAIGHAPGVAAVAPAERREVEKSLKTIKAQISKWPTHRSDPANAIVCQWERRSKAAFQGQSETGQPEQPYQAVARLLKQTRTDADTAWAALKSTASSLPSAIAQYLRAYIGLSTGALLDAQEAIQVALALWPDEPRWHTLAAEISLAQQDALQAAEYCERAIRLEPQHAGHHLLIGQALLELRSQHANPAELTRRATQSFEQATRLEPNLPEAWYALAHIQLHNNDPHQAVISADRAVNLAPEEPEYLLLRAQIALHDHQPGDALQHAQAALNIQPERHTALLLAARALQALDRPEEALALLEHSTHQTKEENSGTPNPTSEKQLPENHAPEKLLALQLERVRALSQTSGTKNALGAAMALAEEYPDQAAALSALAHLQAESGEREEAIRTAQTALQISKAASSNVPIHLEDRDSQVLEARLHYLLGNLQRRAGQLDQAVHHLNQAVHLEPQHIEACLELGQAQQERRQYRQALTAFQQAIAIAPLDPRPHLQAGLALKDGKNYIEAENLLRRAAELAPKDVSIRRQLAAVVALNLVHNRRSVGAENYLEKSVVEH